MLLRILLYNSLNLPCIFRILAAVKALYCFGPDLMNLEAGLFFYNSASEYLNNSQRQKIIWYQLIILYHLYQALFTFTFHICVEVIHQQQGKLLAAGGQTEQDIPLQFVTPVIGDKIILKKSLMLGKTYFKSRKLKI